MVRDDHRQLNATPGALVEVNGVRVKPFLLSHFIRQDGQHSPLLYVFTLGPFLRKLKVNSALLGHSLHAASNKTT